MVLIPCPHCGKHHKNSENVERCRRDQAFLKELRGKLPNALPEGSKEPWGQFSEDYIQYWWGIITIYIRKRDKKTCQTCGAVERPRTWDGNKVDDSGVSLEVHHIIPRARGGFSNPKNLITLCHDCHAKTYHLSHSKIVQMTNKARKDPGQSKILIFQEEKI